VDLSEKWDNSVRDRIFATTLELSARPPEDGSPAPKLILWPETAVPFLFTDRPDALAAIGEMLQPGQLLLTGAVRAEPGSGTDAPRYYNAVIAIDDSGEIADAVDKVHLVPFGEYLPFSGLLARLGIEQLVAGPMNFVAGSQRHPLALPGGIVGLPFICYEIIFPDIVAVDVTSPGVIVNVTNDAWFGETPGPYQHFRQAQVRSVESGMPLLRAANTGISGVIDPRGRIVDGLAMNSRGILDVELAVPASAWNSYPQARLVGFAILLILALFAAAGRVWHGMRAV
jgi:apolipoprotein N-acyltransferase